MTLSHRPKTETDEIELDVISTHVNEFYKLGDETIAGILMLTHNEAATVSRRFADITSAYDHHVLRVIREAQIRQLSSDYSSETEFSFKKKKELLRAMAYRINIARELESKEIQLAKTHIYILQLFEIMRLFAAKDIVNFSFITTIRVRKYFPAAMGPGVYKVVDEDKAEPISKEKMDELKSRLGEIIAFLDNPEAILHFDECLTETKKTAALLEKSVDYVQPLFIVFSTFLSHSIFKQPLSEKDKILSLTNICKDKVMQSMQMLEHKKERDDRLAAMESLRPSGLG